MFRRHSELEHHASKCIWKHPPGEEIYRGSDGIGMWEIDGTKEKQYSQVRGVIFLFMSRHRAFC